MKIVSWILLVAVAVVVAAFAVANRSPVLLSLEPLGYVITLPLYALVIGTLFVGAVIGGGTTWLGAGKTRRAIRAARRRTDRLERELGDARAAAARPVVANDSGSAANVIASKAAATKPGG